jgi:hypothetical protein
LIRLHLLHHAVKEPIFGLGMAEQLASHGYRISPGDPLPAAALARKEGYLSLSTGASREISPQSLSCDADGPAGALGGRSRCGNYFGN